MSAKWGGKTRNATQKLALNVTGNPHVAVTAGFGGALALELVADPLNAAGGAGKVAQAGKAVIKGTSGARAISRAAQGGTAFADAVAAAKQGASLSARTAANSKAGQAIANSKIGKGLQNAGDRLVQHAEGTTAQQAENTGKNIDLRVKSEVNKNELRKHPSKLLPNEGKVGTYKELKMSAKPGDDLSAHHIPSARFMEHHGVKKPDGISMMVQEPTPGIGGRHRLTRTYGRPAKLDETPREALARDVRDMRLIYRDEGVYTPEIHDSLKQVINKNKEKYPNLFGVKDGRN